MISGAHVIVYSKDADADCVFFREVLGFKSVDAGHGWLIFRCRREKQHSTRPLRTVPMNSISCATA